jgi:hypothetical protein
LFKNVTVETGTEAIEAFGGRVVARDPPNKSRRRDGIEEGEKL